MTYKIPDIEVGDKVRMVCNYTFPSGFTLEKGKELSVTYVGEKYGLPFVYVKELRKILQLQPRSYEKV